MSFHLVHHRAAHAGNAPQHPAQADHGAAALPAARGRASPAREAQVAVDDHAVPAGAHAGVGAHRAAVFGVQRVHVQHAVCVLRGVPGRVPGGVRVHDRAVRVDVFGDWGGCASRGGSGGSGGSLGISEDCEGGRGKDSRERPRAEVVYRYGE